MTDPGDEHVEHVAPQPAGRDGLPADNLSRCLGELEAARRRLDEAYAMVQELAARLKRMELVRDGIANEVVQLQLALFNARRAEGKDFDWRGLSPGRLDRDPPVRLNRANNSWEDR